MVISITPRNFKEVVEDSAKPVIVDVYATWCGPCQHMAPFFDELAEQHSTLYTFAKLNVDEARDLAIQYNVNSVPTLLFFKNGELLDSALGYMSKQEMETKIQEVFHT